VPRIEKLKVGPYTAGNDVDYGPVVTAAAKANILRLVETGVAQGAETGGRWPQLQAARL
jgi:malonate-semialdehyde dehydrogenase (acetylating) / methylmalonate-semialdehyde dehydrogenase